MSTAAAPQPLSTPVSPGRYLHIRAARENSKDGGRTGPGHPKRGLKRLVLSTLFGVASSPFVQGLPGNCTGIVCSSKTITGVMEFIQKSLKCVSSLG